MQKLRKFLEEIGPVFAGFQVASSIIGFFGIGAVAKWILENWLPFTRWAWTEIFSFIHFPDISTAEKDALTTLAFFAPMAISSLWAYWGNDADEKPLEIENESFGKETRLRLYATVIGIGFMVVIGGSVIQDGIALFTTHDPNETLEEKSTSVLNIEFFANIGLIATVLVSIATITLLFLFLYQRSQVIQSKTNALADWFTKNTKPIKKAVTKGALHVTVATVTQLIAALVSFGGMSAGVVFAAGQLGFIRTAFPILVLASFLVTIFLNPGRLLKTAGVVIRSCLGKPRLGCCSLGRVCSRKCAGKLIVSGSQA